MVCSRCNGLRVFIILEDEPDNIVYCIDSFVDLVCLQDLTVSFVPPLVIYVHFLLG